MGKKKDELVKRNMGNREQGEQGEEKDTQAYKEGRMEGALYEEGRKGGG